MNVVVAEMGDAYPELQAGRDGIKKTVLAEEDRFDALLISGLPNLEDIVERTAASGSKVVPGDEVFRLYDSLGVPPDFAEDLAGQRGLQQHLEADDAALGVQRDRARTSSGFTKAAGVE